MQISTIKRVLHLPVLPEILQRKDLFCFRIDDDTDTSIVFIVRAGETTLVKVALCFKLSDCFHIELD